MDVLAFYRVEKIRVCELPGFCTRTLLAFFGDGCSSGSSLKCKSSVRADVDLSEAKEAQASEIFPGLVLFGAEDFRGL